MDIYKSLPYMLTLLNITFKKLFKAILDYDSFTLPNVEPYFFYTHCKNISGIILTERFNLNIMFVLSGPHLMIDDKVFQEALNILLCCRIDLLCP